MLSFLFPEGAATALWSSSSEGSVLAQWGSSAVLDSASSLQRAFDRVAQVDEGREVRYVRPRQVHGSTVIEVDRLWGSLKRSGDSLAEELAPPSHGTSFAEADAVVSWSSIGAPVVLTADCLPIALYCAETGGIAAVHAGWRGLVGGVLAETCRLLRRGRSDATIVGAIGPYIHQECYEFKGPEQDLVASRFGPGVFDHDHLNLSLVVEQVCAGEEVDLAFDCGICTGCDPNYPSSRIGGSQERLALAVVMGSRR